MTDPRASFNDLTAKAKIRNAALDLYAERGEDRVSMRAVAAAANVTVGLVQHHFKTKDGLRNAVEQLIVDYHAQALADTPRDGMPAEVAAARDQAVRTMLEDHPPVVNYLRRALLDLAAGEGKLLARLTELSRNEVAKLRMAGIASTSKSEAEQVIGLMIRQLGHLFLQPMVDAMWNQLSGPDMAEASKPSLKVETETRRTESDELR
ncbi:TetR family transcriptional regulator [Rhodococcus qingshengii]|uniref:TetR/AcrR family transcriptional regulator n=1 Tax=Rhodococcus TaxID=1827 RepID=UPI000717EB25|nr:MULTISPECIES: TetR/AcrR family transcriptional regulator [Rhodococcus]MBP1054301.1 TetR family transcriptional regulator [Rhodococcus qingshengii]MBP2521037.1 AcrR family transcriptional regulator [Rhodococcus sp. PvP104]MDA3637741.1 TetR/AcrR family transcriptional regulator [Rhodococcus sp. C-2]MYV31803.1 TetR family transcriptional regulator [Rhodococcus erythropolis]